MIMLEHKAKKKYIFLIEILKICVKHFFNKKIEKNQSIKFKI
jgi:hypothetical protein